MQSPVGFVAISDGGLLFLATMKGIIYKATNMTDGKVYIGQTTMPLKRRISIHLHDAEMPKTRFHKAINRYGENAFKWEIIEEITASDIGILKRLLGEAEIRYIEQYGSEFPHSGYNTQPGGTDYRPKPSYRTLKRSEQRNGYGTCFALYYCSTGNLKSTFTSIAEANAVHNNSLFRKVFHINDIARVYCQTDIRFFAVEILPGETIPQHVDIINISPKKPKGMSIIQYTKMLSDLDKAQDF